MMCVWTTIKCQQTAKFVYDSCEITFIAVTKTPVRCTHKITLNSCAYFMLLWSLSAR